MHSLKVNETKVTLRNVFILDLFALGDEKESKYNERTPLLGFRAETPSLRKTHIRVYPDHFSFKHFFLLFLDIKIKFTFKVACYFI